VGLIELELLGLLAGVDAPGEEQRGRRFSPACVLEVPEPARILDDSVERHELGYDDLSHFSFSFSFDSGNCVY
jgi:hypothetical protein